MNFYPPTDPTQQARQAEWDADQERLERERRCGALPPLPPHGVAVQVAEACRPASNAPAGGSIQEQSS